MSNSHAIMLLPVSHLAQSRIIQIQKARANKPIGRRSSPPMSANITLPNRCIFVLSLIVQSRRAFRHRRGLGGVTKFLPRQTVLSVHFKAPGVISNEVTLALARDENGTWRIALYVSQT